MSTDFYTTDSGIEFTDTNDIRLRDGTENAKQQLTFTVKRVVSNRTVRTRTDRSRLVAALRDALRDNPYADEVGQIDVTRNGEYSDSQSESEDLADSRWQSATGASLLVTIQIGSDDFEIQT